MKSLQKAIMITAIISITLSCNNNKKFEQPKPDDSFKWQVDQFDDHDRRQAPDLIFAIAITGYIPAAALVIDTVGMVTRVLAEKLQRHGEYCRDLGVIGAVFDEVGDNADERCHFQAMQ